MISKSAKSLQTHLDYGTFTLPYLANKPELVYV